MLAHFSLFTGIGGFDLAAEWAGFKTVGQCEINYECERILRKRWPDVERFHDIRQLCLDDLRRRGIDSHITLITGGFPCQPRSIAGKRRGSSDDRDLWPEMLRVVRELKPSWVVAENPPGILTMDIDGVLAGLEAADYQVGTFVLPAASVDSPHIGSRVFIVGAPKRFSSEPRRISEELASKARESQSNGCQWERVRLATDTAIERGRDGIMVCTEKERTGDSRFYWPSEPRLARMADGLPHQMDRLRMLGNCVNPELAYPILKGISDIESAQSGKR